MDGKVTINRHVNFDIVVDGYNLTLDANIVLHEYNDRKLAFVKLFNKINSIRMLHKEALDSTGFKFTDKYARVQLAEDELSNIKIGDMYKKCLDILKSALNNYYKLLDSYISEEE